MCRAWRAGVTQLGAAEQAEATATVGAALAAGVTFFDTAEAYGNNQVCRVAQR